MASYEWFSWFPSSQDGQNLLFDNALLVTIAFFLRPRSYQFKNIIEARLIFALVVISVLIPFDLLLYFKIVPEHVPFLNGIYWMFLAFIFILFVAILMGGINKQYKLSRSKEEILAMFYCLKCEHQNRVPSRFCSKCGARLNI